MDLVRVGLDAALKFGFGIEMQGKTLTDIRERHLVAAVMAAFDLVWVTQHNVNPVVITINVHADFAWLRGTFYTVIYGIFEQRLNDKWWNKRVRGHFFYMPRDLEPFT